MCGWKAGRERRKWNEERKHFIWLLSLNTFQNTIKYLRVENGILCIHSKLELLAKYNNNNVIRTSWMHFPSHHSGHLNQCLLCYVMLNSHDLWKLGLICSKNSLSSLCISSYYCSCLCGERVHDPLRWKRERRQLGPPEELPGFILCGGFMDAIFLSVCFG